MFRNYVKYFTIDTGKMLNIFNRNGVDFIKLSAAIGMPSDVAIGIISSDSFDIDEGFVNSMMKVSGVDLSDCISDEGLILEGIGGFTKISVGEEVEEDEKGYGECELTLDEFVSEDDFLNDNSECCDGHCDECSENCDEDETEDECDCSDCESWMQFMAPVGPETLLDRLVLKNPREQRIHEDTSAPVYHPNKLAEALKRRVRMLKEENSELEEENRKLSEENERLKEFLFDIKKNVESLDMFINSYV